MKHVVIIGNGIAGVTAARNIRKRCDDRISIVSAETEHFFSRTALMYVYMGHMKFEHTKPYEDWFWKKNKIDLVFERVTEVSFDSKTLVFSSGKSLPYDVLIIATGSKPNMFGWKGQDLIGAQGLYSYQDLLKLEENTDPPGTPESKRTVTRAVVAGGGLIGVELVEMLLSRHIEVYFLVREKNFWNNVLPAEESKLIQDHMNEHHVHLRLEDEIAEIIDDGNGKVGSVLTKSGKVILCQLVGLTAGVSPNVDFLRTSGLEINRGILVDEYLQTNISDVYAIGDCAELKYPPQGRRSIEAVWYVGRMMGETVAETICGKRNKYRPGNWFNSAKFFDVEYQTYGDVPSQIAEENTFVWRHPSKNILIRLVCDNQNILLGINVVGMRLRHEVVDRWLNEKRSMDYAVEHLADANFDPEFYKRHEADIVAFYNKKYWKELKPAKKDWRRILGKL